MPLTSLPVEILARIVLFVNDRSTLKALRLSCHSLEVVARQELFKIVILYHNPNSCERLEHILDSGLAGTIRTILIHIWNNQAPEMQFLNGSWMGDAFRPLPTEERGIATQPLWHEADNISWGSGPVHETRILKVQIIKLIFSELVALPNPIQQLVVHGIHEINTTVSETIRSIQSVLTGLHELRLDVEIQRYRIGQLYACKPVHFFRQIPDLWLKPTMSTLRRLTLSSEVPFGVLPKLDLRDVHFPRLQSLALGSYQFGHDSQLNWILEHGSTLKEILLYRCSITFQVLVTSRDPHCVYINEDMIQRDGGDWEATYTKTWRQYFDAFREGLPKLRHFRIGYGIGWNKCLYKTKQGAKLGLAADRYKSISNQNWPHGHTEYEDTFQNEWARRDEEDCGALRALLQSIGAIGEEIDDRDDGGDSEDDGWTYTFAHEIDLMTV